MQETLPHEPQAAAVQGPVTFNQPCMGGVKEIIKRGLWSKLFWFKQVSIGQTRPI